MVRLNVEPQAIVEVLEKLKTRAIRYVARSVSSACKPCSSSCVLGVCLCVGCVHVPSVASYSTVPNDRNSKINLQLPVCAPLPPR